MVKSLVLGIAAFAAMNAVAIQIITPTVDEHCGVSVLDKSADTWKSIAMGNPDRHEPEAFTPIAEDFFTLEYGFPMDFTGTRDPIAAVRALGKGLEDDIVVVKGDYRLKDGALEITSADSNGEFGVEFRELRFAQQYGTCLSQRGFIEIELEQSSPTSVWQFAQDSHWHQGKLRRGGEIVFEGAGPHRIVRQAFQAQGMFNCCNIGLYCLTPDAGIRLKSVKLRPRAGDVFYRKTFNLPFKPDVAKISFMTNPNDNNEIIVNGHDIARPTGWMCSIEVMNDDIAKYLKEGENVIAVRNRYTCIYRMICGFEEPTRLLLDLFAYDRIGRTFTLCGDTSWKTALSPQPPDWASATFDDSKWRHPVATEKFSRLTNGKPIALGLNPQHMGFITVMPVGTKYPVFAAESTAIRRFTVSFPSGLKDAKLEVELRTNRALGKQHVYDNKAADPRMVKTVEQDGMRCFDYEITETKPGPYKLVWHLTAEGVDETREDEVVLVGKIEQEIFEPKDFEEEFRKRLELIRTIDPVKEHEIGENFTSSCGRGQRYAKIEVVEKAGLKYLSLVWPKEDPGSEVQSWMGWKIDTPDLGGAYHVEIDVPDDADRTVNACAIYSVPAMLDNCPGPCGQKAEIAASAAITTGGIQKPSGGVKTLSMFFYAANKINTIVIAQTYPNQTPAPAAVAAIRVYHLKDGRLPGMAVPPTTRRIMEHHERFTTWATLAACDNLADRSDQFAAVYHKDAWAIWYRAIERKIRQLKFQGQNASIEGIYMYDHSTCPDATCLNAPVRGEEFDVPYLLSWMYDANGIDCYFGWEQNRTTSSRRLGIERGVSDWKVKKGLDRGIYSVDSNGNQIVSYAYSCVNMNAEGIKKDSFDAIKRVYDRYEKHGHVKGFFLAHGFFWVPGFPIPRGGDSLKFGYDDDTIELFERDTGIRLDTGTTDIDRFRRRAELLNGKYREQYLDWRRDIQGRWFRDLTAMLKSGANEWPLLISPNFSHGGENHEFNMAERMRREGWTTDYRELGGDTKNFLPLGINPWYKWGSPAGQRAWTQLLEMPETQELIAKSYGIYAAYMLSEGNLYHNVPDVKWWWRGHSALCRYQRPAGKLAYLRERQMCSQHCPNSIVIAGIDCNPYTGQAEECRRFAAEFYRGKVSLE